MSKIMFRVFFVISAALIITILSALLGNYLNKKIADADELTRASKEEAGLPLSREDEATVSAGEKSDFSMRGAGISLSDCTGEDELLYDIEALSEYYDTLIIPITSSSGALLYSSPALSSITRQPDEVPVSDEANVNGDGDADEVEADSGTGENKIDRYSLLVSAAAAARDSGMTVCALMEPSRGISSPENAAFIDSIIINELYGNGVEHVLLRVSATDNDSSKWILRYAAALDCDGSEPGFAFSSEYLQTAEGIKQIQTLAESGAFLGVYFPSFVGSYEQIYDSVTHQINSMLGVFSVYTMNVLVERSYSAVYNACLDAGITSVSFTGFVLPDELTPENVETSPESTETEPESRTNPYASTSDDYEDESETRYEPDAQPDAADETEGIKLWY